MITEARLKEDLRSEEGVDWITALRAPAIRKLVRNGSLQLSLFDEKDWPKFLIRIILMSDSWCARIRSWLMSGPAEKDLLGDRKKAR